MNMNSCKTLLKEEYDYPLRMTADKSCKYNICHMGKEITYIRMVPNDSRVIQEEPYIYVIRKDEPTNIYYYPENNKRPSKDYYYVCDESAGKWNNRTRTTINHNCLANNTNIICGGQFTLYDGSKITLTNKSGHYIPDGDCLAYATCLFKSFGFNVENWHYVAGSGNKTIKYKNKKKLSKKKLLKKKKLSKKQKQKRCKYR